MSLRRTTSRFGSTTRRSTRLVLALTVGAGLVAATPGAAQARTVSDADAVKDMSRLLDGEEGGFKAAPRHRLNEVKSTDLFHTADKVGAELTLAQLSKTGVLSWSVEIISSKGEVRHARLYAREGSWSGELTVDDPEAGEDVECGRYDIDYADDVVRMTLPKDCIGGGRWMRFRVFAGHSTDNGYFVDDALLDRALKDGDKRPVLSRRIYR